MKTVNVVLYNYNELSKEAQENAMNQYIEFIIDTLEVWKDDFKKDIEEAEKNQTPWFLGQIIYHNNKDKLIKELECLGDCFYNDGTKFNKGK